MTELSLLTPVAPRTRTSPPGAHREATGHSVGDSPTGTCPLLSAPQVHFTLLLKLDPHVEVRHQLFEGLEGVLDVSERGEQFQPAADLPQLCNLLPPCHKVSPSVPSRGGQQFVDRAGKALFLPLGQAYDRLPPRC